MSTPNDGGPAFPQVETIDRYANDGCVYGDTYSTGGMSLRDYFAAQAMVGLLSNPRVTEDWINKGHHITSAFAIADSMLAARKGASK